MLLFLPPTQPNRTKSQGFAPESACKWEPSGVPIEPAGCHPKKVSGLRRRQQFVAFVASLVALLHGCFLQSKKAREEGPLDERALRE